FVESLPLPRLDIAAEQDVIVASSGAPLPAADAPAPVDTQRLRSLLRQGEALVDFYVDGNEVTAFVLTETGLACRTMPLGADGADLMSAARWPGRPDDRDRAVTEAWRAAARDLGERLLSPLAEDLHGARTLLIVPGGGLHGVPFAALAMQGR